MEGADSARTVWCRGSVEDCRGRGVLHYLYRYKAFWVPKSKAI